MILSDFKKAITEKDYKKMSECFSEHCRLFDYCPGEVGLASSYVYGRKAVDMFYHNKFVLGGLSFMDPQIVNERVVDFYANYGGTVIHAVAAIESYDPESGLINEMVIRPA